MLTLFILAINALVLAIGALRAQARYDAPSRVSDRDEAVRFHVECNAA